MEEKKLIAKKGDNGKWGYVDNTGEWVIEPKFIEADEFDRGIARVRYDWLWGFLKEDGSWLFEPVLNDADPFSDEIACVKKGLCYGFINRKGVWFIEPNIIEVVKSSNKDLFGIKNRDRRCAIISNQGKWITEFELAHLPDFGDYSIRVDKDSKYGFLDYKGNWIIPPIYQEAFEAKEERIFAGVEKNSYFYLIDLNGNILSEEKLYLDVFSGLDFKDGRIIVKIETEKEGRNLYTSLKCGVIGSDGKWIIEPVFDEIKDFNDGYAIVKVEDKYGVINDKGDFVIEAAYDEIKHGIDFYILVKNKKEGIGDPKRKFLIPPKYNSVRQKFSSNGLIEIEKRNKYGLINTDGKEIIKPNFDYIDSDFNKNGYIRVKIEDKYGWVNKKGSFLTDQLYEESHDFKEDIAAVKLNGRWGYIDIEGNIVADPKFDTIYDFKNGVAIAGISGHFGLIDKSGGWIVDPKFDEIREFNDGIAPAKIFNSKLFSSKWGFIDETGQFIIEPEFDDIQNFMGEYAQVNSNGKWGLIDRKGNWFVKPEYEEIKNFVNELAVIVNDGKEGLIDKSGKVIISPAYDEIPTEFDRELLIVENKNKYGLVNQNGEEIIAPTISRYWRHGRFMWAQIKKKWGYLDFQTSEWIIEPRFDEIIVSFDSINVVEFEGKWGAVDLLGNWIVNPVFPDSFRIDSLHNGVLKAELDNKKGLYDLIENKWAVPPLYADISYLDKDLFLVSNDGKKAIYMKDGNLLNNKWYEDIIPYTNNIVWDSKDAYLFVKEDGKYGVMGLDGQWILTPTFDEIGFKYRKFQDGITRVTIGDKGGIVDKKGNIIGGRMYDGVYNYEKGYMIVENDKKVGMINTQGQLIIPPIYYELDHFENGLAKCVTTDGLHGFIDMSGNVVIKPFFEWAESFKKKYARVKSNGKYGIIDKQGDWIVEPKFEDIKEVAPIMPAKENGKYGYINLYGEWIAPPIYLEAQKFYNNYGEVVTDDYNKGYINSNGKFSKKRS